MLDALAALVPSVCVGLLFWFVIRAIIAGDRRERAAMAALDLADRENAETTAADSPDEYRDESR